jgi:Flp pilus assembly protein TadD
MRLSSLIVCMTLAPTLAAAAENAALAQAKTKAEDLDYAGALKLLDAALEVEGNEREALLEIYELKGVAWATLGKLDKARDAFRTLVVLDPGHALSGAHPPRVKTPFYEAKE